MTSSGPCAMHMAPRIGGSRRRRCVPPGRAVGGDEEAWTCEGSELKGLGEEGLRRDGRVV